MCGICGGFGKSAPNGPLLSKQLDLMRHRGPDQLGIFTGNNLSLGIVRLAIVDITGGVQPTSDEIHGIHAVFNGEIYNYRDLQIQFPHLKRGGSFLSETELIAALYLEQGPEFVHRLNGMFAIVIYDRRNNNLLMYRDRLGEKPLWYTKLSDGTLLFASEVKALMLVRPDLTLRTDMISEVMQFGYINSPNSAFCEIQQVPPASYLSSKNGVVEIKKYWNLNFETIDLSYNEAKERTRNLMESAVQSRLISERPIGAFLSGGYDSSLATALMVKNATSRVKTFSIGFKEVGYDESRYSREIARFLGTEHYEEFIEDNPDTLISGVMKYLDQPFADSSIIPTFHLARFARKEVVVAIGGEGGDEVFGGYDRYIAAPLLQRYGKLLRILKRGLGIVDEKFLPEGRQVNRNSEQLRKFRTLCDRYSSIVALVKPHEVNQFLNPSLLSDQALNTFQTRFSTGNLSDLSRMVRSDLEFYLPGDLLIKADIATMANSLEMRTPFLDHRLVEWGVSLPENYRIQGFWGKKIVKDIAHSLIPRELLERPKMGFSIPRATWLRSGLKEITFDLLTDTTAIQRGWFNTSEVQTILKMHMEGKDHDRILWPILMLELWARTWWDRKSFAV